MTTQRQMIRPQPIDLAPWPLGGLLVPDVDGGRELARAAVAGEAAPADGPLAFWARAAVDDADGALAALEGLDDPACDYDRFVLAPSAERLEELRQRFDGPLAELLEVAAFRVGLRESPPTLQVLDGELLASARATEASAALERGDHDGAAEALRGAIDAARTASPGLAAQLYVSLIETERARNASADQVVELLKEALACLGESGFDTLRAELQLEQAVVLQEAFPARLGEAAALFQDALRALDPTTHRRAYGFTQMRLGLAYLSMPMADAGDALRMGVATQALKRAVDVLDPAQESELWCAAATNLANAYQVLPSGHLGDNLETAVDLYGRALGIRTAELDPLGHARLLVNRANACASLERFDDAIGDLRGAVPLLQSTGASEELTASRQLLQSLERTRATAGELA